MSTNRPERSLLVVDADIARGAGTSSSSDPSSKACRDVLNRILNICHNVVFDQRLISEWNRHQSDYARSWRVDMNSRGKITVVPTEILEPLRKRIREDSLTEDEVEEAVKDAHLIELAHFGDSVIITHDSNAEENFRKLSNEIDGFPSFLWFKPGQEDIPMGRWLQRGASVEAYENLS